MRNSRTFIPLFLVMSIFVSALAGLSAPMRGASASARVRGATSAVRPGSIAPARVATVVAAPRVATTAIGLIDTARRSVSLEMYELGNPSVVAALEAARRRGVLVRVVSDPTEYQSEASDAQLARAGVGVRRLRVAGGIDHVKLLVVDDSRVLIGGVNLGFSSAYTADADVELSGFGASYATSIFDQDWAAAAGSRRAASGVFGPFVTGTAIEPAMLSMISHATRRCTVLANYLSDYDIQDALVAAERRGVQITVVLNPTSYGEVSAVSWLHRGGVHVELAPRQPYLHAKVLSCGNEAMIGSANFSFSGMSVNHELDVVLVGNAAAKVAVFANNMARADA